MRIGLVTLHNPWGASNGGAQRVAALLDALARHGHEVACVHPGAAGTSVPAGVVDVPVNGHPVGQRTWPSALRNAKRRFVPMPTSVGARNPALAAAMRELLPLDVVVAGEFPAAAYRRAAPGALFWLDLPDLYSEFARYEAAARTGVARLTATSQEAVLAWRERQLYPESAVVTVAGWADAQRLRQRVRQPVAWLPNTFVMGDPLPPPSPSAQRVAGYFADFAFGPNVDAAEVLARHWAPRLADAGWRVVVAGHGSEALRLPAAVEVIGPVDSPRSFYERTAVTLAPYRIGPGMKTKVLESLAFGRPVIASPAAIAGFPPDFRTYVCEVDLLAPDIPRDPPTIPAGLPEALQQFSPSTFARTVGDLLAGISRRA